MPANEVVGPAGGPPDSDHNGLPERCGENPALTAKGNFQPPPHLPTPSPSRDTPGREASRGEAWPAGIAFLHLLPQFQWHSTASIAGTVEGLTALRDAMTAAIESGEAKARVVTTDGEGYVIEVTRHRCTSELGNPPYLTQMIMDGMAAERELQDRWRRRDRPASSPTPPQETGHE